MKIHANHANHAKQQLTAGKIAIAMRCILSANDTGFLMAGAATRANLLHGVRL